ncbi:bifunctional 3-demethylubiquinone-9 3-methyltransferase/ 2-octaprenyl-6-hydroxy phenol methylase [compost metagenome]
MNVILFGAGEVYDSFIERLPKRFNILAVADNNTRLHGQYKNGVVIIPPEDIHVYNPDFIIISCLSRHVADITIQLIELGLDHLHLPFPYDEESELKDRKQAEKKGLIGLNLVSEIIADKNTNGSVFYHISLGNNFDAYRNKYIANSTSRHLHIGSGHSLGVEIYSVLRWGGEWTAIEPFPGITNEYPFNDHLSMIKDFVSFFNIPINKSDKIIFNCSDQATHIDENNCSSLRINYFPGMKLEEFHDDEGYDVCYSCAVMEHVVDVESFVAKTFQLLSPGGFAFHWIDLRDHRDFSRPLDFLKIGKSEWYKKYCESGHFLHGNQLRHSDYRLIFIQLGFKIVAEEIYMKNDNSYIREVSIDFPDEYASLTWADLEVSGVLFVLEKPTHDN